MKPRSGLTGFAGGEVSVTTSPETVADLILNALPEAAPTADALLIHLTVPRAELDACAVALDNYHHDLGLIIGLAVVFFIVLK